MSLPPSDMQAVSGKTATRRGITKWNVLLVVLFTLALSGAYLLIDIALDPALLPHAARAGRLPVLLILVGFGFFMGFCILVEVEAKRSRVERALNVLSILLLGPMLPIWSIAWLDPYLPNMRYGILAATGLGVADIGFIPYVLSLLYGLLAARRRHETEEAYAKRGIPAREKVVGFEPLVRAVTVIWFLVLVTASAYGIWLAHTNTADDATLFLSLSILWGAFVVVIVPFFWLLRRTRRYARQAGDAALLTSTTLPNAARVRPQRVKEPPEERPRWGLALLIGLGLFAFSLLTFAVLDLYYIQAPTPNGTPNWISATLFPVFSWAGFLRASARRYPPTRFWRLLVAAAAFVVAGDAMWIDSMHPHHSIVPPLGLLIIAVVCSTLGVLICRSMLLHPMWEVNREPNGTAQLDPAFLRNDVTGGQKRPRVAPYLVLLQPLLFVVEHLLVYGDASARNNWEPYVFLAVIHSILFALAVVITTDMPKPQAQRPAK